MVGFIILLVNIIVLGALAFLGYRNLRLLEVRKYYFPALIAKLVCGLTLGLLYKYYYNGGDTFFFFEQAQSFLNQPLSSYFQEVFFESIPYDQRSTLPIIKILSLFLLITGSNYWIASLWFSLVSFAGSFYLFNKLVRKYPNQILPVAISLLFLPSICFWSSGILKESIVFGGMMFISGVYLKWNATNKIGIVEAILVLFVAWVVLLLKYYIAAVFLPLITWLTIVVLLRKANFWNSLNEIYKYLGLGVIMLALVFWAINLQYNLSPERVFSVIQRSHELVVQDNAHSIHFFDTADYSWLILPNFIMAGFAGLFLPLIPNSVIQGLACLENWVVLIVFFLSFRRICSLSKAEGLQVITTILMIMILSTLLSYSNPNLGTIARYKVYYLPFFLILILVDNPLIQAFQKRFMNTKSSS